PDLSTTLNVTGQRTTCGLDLAGRQTATGDRLQSELAEADLATALSQTTVVAGPLLAAFCTLGLQHLAYSLLGSFFTRRRRLRLELFVATTNHFAFEDPDLDADHTVSGVRFVGVVVDIGTQGVQRHTTFPIPFRTGNFSPTQTTAHLDLDAFGTNANGVLYGALHGATEHNATLQLLSNVLCYQHCIEFRLADFFDVDVHRHTICLVRS